MSAIFVNLRKQHPFLKNKDTCENLKVSVKPTNFEILHLSSEKCISKMPKLIALGLLKASYYISQQETDPVIVKFNDIYAANYAYSILSLLGVDFVTSYFYVPKSEINGDNSFANYAFYLKSLSNVNYNDLPKHFYNINAYNIKGEDILAKIEKFSNKYSSLSITDIEARLAKIHSETFELDHSNILADEIKKAYTSEEEAKENIHKYVKRFNGLSSSTAEKAALHFKAPSQPRITLEEPINEEEFEEYEEEDKNQYSWVKWVTGSIGFSLLLAAVSRP
ncbi:MAG TPA: hypothetical protein DCL21_07285 [Alphaproteobacteria bacterium]|nr:hypothetical protein [Alphaproteobacteria bacterium]